MPDRELVVGVGAVAQADAQAAGVDLALDLGPDHPSSHGLLTLRLTLSGDQIAAARVRTGYLHRGAEKLFEARDYRQIMVLANRHDWLSAFSNEWGVALAVERMLGLDVPPRAEFLRVAIAELGRIVHHVAFLCPVVDRDRSGPDALSLRDTRAHVLSLLEQATGGRVHLMAARIGGLRNDVPSNWTQQVRALPDLLEPAITHARGVLATPEMRGRFSGIGVLTTEQAIGYAVSGPVARASGVDRDLRRDDPYGAYALLATELDVAIDTRGDALARLTVLLDQCLASLRLAIAACDRLDAMPGAPVHVPLPKVLRLPEGTTYAATESPSGLNGYLLVSRGDKTPWRLKMRTASFASAAALEQLLVGATVEQLVPILQSMLFIIGDIDK